MLTWETNSPPELKGAHKYDPKQGSVKIILDGQQRITTLYILMTGNIPPYYKEDDITYDIKPLHVNIETLELEYYKKTMMENNPLWVHITDIFQDKLGKIPLGGFFCNGEIGPVGNTTFLHGYTSSFGIFRKSR